MPRDYTPYLTYMQYFATGEGVTVQLLMSMVFSKQEAIEKHLDKYVGDRKEARDYFRNDIEVMKVDSKKAKKLMVDMFIYGEAMWEHIRKAGLTFNFEMYYNHS